MNGELFSPHFRFYNIKDGQVFLGDTLTRENAVTVCKADYVVGRENLDLNRDVCF